MNTPLWTITDVAEGCQGRIVGAPGAEISGISIDTRTLQPGEAFFAIAGDRFDGHDFVGAALEKGAAVAVVAEDKLAGLPADGRYVVVDDVLKGLENLGRAARARTTAKVIGVTGSVGKTGTKEALRLVLSRQGKTHASAASFNNHWGVPLSLARLPADADFAVFEMGMNHPGEIAPLSAMVLPEVAIITTIAPVHLENMGSLEAIAEAKAEIFTGLVPGGAAVLPADVAQFPLLAERAREFGAIVVDFGMADGAAARLLEVAIKADCSAVRASILGDDITYKVGAPGRHLVLNSLAVLAAVKLAGADLVQAAMAMSHFTAPGGRGEQHRLAIGHGDMLLIDESYNANPASMAAALEVLGASPVGEKGRRIAVLGDMLELGADGAKLHAAIAGDIAANRIDLVFCCGPLMRALWDALPADARGGYAETAANLESKVAAALKPGDTLMIKGSNGSKMGPLTKALIAQFPPADAAEQG